MSKSLKLHPDEQIALKRLIEEYGSIRKCASHLNIHREVIRKLRTEGRAGEESVRVVRIILNHREVFRAVCHDFAVAESEMYNKKPDETAVNAKQFVIYLLNRRYKVVRPVIAGLFGYPDHTYINKVCARVEGYLDVDYQGSRAIMKRIVEQIENS